MRINAVRINAGKILLFQDEGTLFDAWARRAGARSWSHCEALLVDPSG
ncbi:hypothetical protein QFZ79_003076 [Arthrobacter sp. V4I6]|nr:hypothetical protein [Arthrobacter sp. V1I7]MDQ0854965.1 hypothetical protein [Arthrobacter sp. V4I6]